VVTYLLDTAPFLWAVADPGKLSAVVRKLIESRNHRLFVSVASLWEVVLKARKGLLHLEDPPRWLEAGIRSIEAEVLPIKAAHVYAVGQLPAIHKDPFDRVLLAQAASEGWTLISNDRLVRRYAVPAVW
jgi:PIN domain nuclease of toxin-antitoxin system